MFRHLTDILIAWGPLGILFLSILDSAGLPVAGVFDALLILIAVKTPSVGWLCAALAVVGSTAGNTILFWTAHRGGRRFMDSNAAPTSRAARFRGWFRRYGLVTIFVPAMIPIPMPLKLFVISAGVMGTSLWEFVPVVLLARIIRYFGEVWLGIRLGEDSTKFLRTHAWMLLGGAAGLFASLYLFILWRGRQGAKPAV